MPAPAAPVPCLCSLLCLFKWTGQPRAPCRPLSMSAGEEAAEEAVELPRPRLQRTTTMLAYR